MQTPTTPDLFPTTLGGTYEEAFQLLREAAFRILEAHAEDWPIETNEPFSVVRARHAGFTVSYYRAAPGSLAKMTRGFWRTTEGREFDPFQHVIDISFGEAVVGIGWRGNGPIAYDQYRQGPWEFAFLLAAGMPLSPKYPELKYVGYPLPESRWKGSASYAPKIEERLSSVPMTLSVKGYSTVSTGPIPKGSTIGDIHGCLQQHYYESREADDQLSQENWTPTNFALHVWWNHQAPRNGKPRRKAECQVWFRPKALYTAAVALLQFDYEMETFRSKEIEAEDQDYKRTRSKISLGRKFDELFSKGAFAQGPDLTMH